jgi:hypothetical protein
MRAIFSRPRRGRRRRTAVRDWPVGFRAPVDPWDTAPLFDESLIRQAAARSLVTW